MNWYEYYTCLYTINFILNNIFFFIHVSYPEDLKKEEILSHFQIFLAHIHW